MFKVFILFLSLIVAGLVLLTRSSEVESEETFTASTPCEEQSKFLLNIPLTIDCEFMKWELSLARNTTTGDPSVYKLHIRYGMTKPNTNGFAGTPHEIQRTGKWTVESGLTNDKGAQFYALLSDNTEKSLLFRRLNGRLLHLQDSDGRLMVGNGGWSYTLNRTADSSKTQGRNQITNTLSPAGISGTPTSTEKFVGRSPCRELAQIINRPARPECIKIKWSFTFHRDPVTGEPTTYKVRHTLIRELIEKEGKWSIIRGTTSDPKAIIYHVDSDKTEGDLFLQMIDENVLVILDKKMLPLVGNGDYSFTLNRATPQSKTP